MIDDDWYEVKLPLDTAHEFEEVADQHRFYSISSAVIGLCRLISENPEEYEEAMTAARDLVDDAAVIDEDS